MVLSHEYFRRHVSRSSLIVISIESPNLSRHAEVNQLAITIRVENNVFRPDVSVDDSVLVQVL
jgi:hypothetical protein